MKKLNVIISLVLSMVLVLAACSSTPTKTTQDNTTAPATDAATTAPSTEAPTAAPQGKESITFMHWDGGAAKDSMEKAVKGFMDQNPNINVKLEFVPRDMYDQKLNALITAGSPPDVSYVSEGVSVPWGMKGTLTDLTPFIDLDPELKGNLVASYSNAGKTYGVMTTAEIMLMFYNKKLFADAGIEVPSADAAKPWTWDQFLDAARKLTTDSSGKHPVEAGFEKNKIKTFGAILPAWWAPLETLMRSNGGGYVSEDGLTPMISHPETTEVLQKIADLTFKEFVSPNPGQSKTLPSAPSMVQNGQLAMYIGGQWELNAFKAINYTDVGFAAMPIFKKPINIVFASSTSIFEKSKHKEAAWKLVKYLMDPVSNLTMHAEGYWMPINKNWYSDPELLKKWTDNPTHSGNYVQLAQTSLLSNNVSYPYIMRLVNFDKIDPILGAPLGKIFAGQQSATDALAGFEDKIKPLLKGFYQ
jgi:multiple sugar transport system substrate-binding protein